MRELLPLPCEMQRQPFPSLTNAERERAATGLAMDTITVCRYVIRNEAIPWTRTLDLLVDSLSRRKLTPLALRAIARVTAYARFQLQYDAQVRSLTNDEREVEAAALRLSRAFHGPED